MSLLALVGSAAQRFNSTTGGGFTAGEALTNLSTGSTAVLATILALAYVAFHVLWQLIGPKDASAPPMVFHTFPVIGSAVTYGMDPYAFFENCRKKYGNVFTFVLLNKKVTVALGPAGSNLILNGRLSEVNAEEAYTQLTTPVFGADVVYDVPNAILMQQKKFVKYGLSTENFTRYVPMIVEEVTHQLNDLFKSSKSPSVTHDAFTVASQITICTASATLQGKEVRAGLDKSFADLYHDLDGGFTPINWVFPNLPLPSYRRRDRAQVAMRNFYLNIMKKRRAEERDEEESDMIAALQNQVYKDGRTLSDIEIAHIMIALLMAGQHTSAATGSWLLLHLAERPNLVEELRAEQDATFGSKGGQLDPLDYQRLQTPLLNACIKEVLRMHPPIHSIMRVVKSPITVPPTLAAPSENRAYVIPSGHTVMAAPGVSQIDPAIWRDPLSFDPSRWLTGDLTDNPYIEDTSEKVDYGFGAINSGANSPYLPFGAGRHRCIGEQFAYVQLATVVATVIRNVDLSLPQKFPNPDYTTMLVCPKAPRDIIFTRRQQMKA